MTEHYVRDFQAFASNGAAGAPAWLREIRKGAIARFAELGFPTMKQEAWRFTSVAPIAETRFTLASAARSPLPAAAEIERLNLGAGPRLVFVDGRYVPGLSSLAGLPDGVYAGGLAAALKAGPSGALARTHLARHADWRDSAFAALNTAFLPDGAFVHVSAGCRAAAPPRGGFVPHERGSGEPEGAHPGGLLVGQRGAEAGRVVTHPPPGGRRPLRHA